MKKIDTRVQYTKEMFHRALLNLMETKPINKITIKELCEAASLNRGTFTCTIQNRRIFCMKLKTVL